MITVLRQVIRFLKGFCVHDDRQAYLVHDAEATLDYEGLKPVCIPRLSGVEIRPQAVDIASFES
jgi:hypothetical protein